MAPRDTIEHGETESAVRSLDSGDWHVALRVLWRKRLMILGSGLACMGLGAGYALGIAEPRYSAEARVMLDPRDDQVLDLRSVVSDLGRDERIVNTEVEVLRSRSLVGQVVDRLDLTGDPEFNPDLAGEKAALFPWPVTSPAGLAGDALRDRAVSLLIDRVTVQNPPDSLVFSLRTTADDPQTAATIANTLAETYIGDQVAARMEATERATSWLSARVAELKQEVEVKEARAKAFGSESEGLSDGALDGLLRQIAAIKQHLRDAEMPAAEEAGYREELTRLSEQAEAESQALVEMRQLERDAEASRLIYAYFLTRLKETAVQQGSQQADSRLLSAAVVPRAASFPHVPLILSVAFVLGAGLGGLAVLIADALQTRFRTPGEVERFAGQPVLGMIPEPPNIRDLVGALGHALRNRSAPLPEAVRQLRTALLLADPRQRPRTVLITSSRKGEGKTTLALLMAENMSGLGRKVLLVEADVRRPKLRDALGLDRGPGLLAVLARAVPLDQAVRRVRGLDADILPADSSVMNAADILASARFSQFLGEVRRSYDYVIIDSAPVLSVPDARIIGPLVDRILYLVAWNSTLRAELRRGLALYETIGLRPDGLVLSRVDLRKMDQLAREDGYQDSFAYA